MAAEFYLARRYLFSRRQGAWGWLISSIAIGGVALGVAALIVTNALMTGFREDIRQRLMGIYPHVLITPFSASMNANDPTLLAELQKDRQIEFWSPFVDGQVLIGRGKFNMGASIKGIDPIIGPKLAGLNHMLIEGQWTDLTNNPLISSPNKPKIILGQELARAIGARVGDIIWIITPNSIGLTALSMPQARFFEVSGLIHTGLYDYDMQLAYTDVASAQKLYDMGNAVTGVGVRLKDPEQADQKARELVGKLSGRYWVRSWLAQNRNLFSALKLERTVMLLLLGLLTIVAAFMIVSNLLLNITQKTRDIGILRAMGASPQMISRVFLLKGILLGIIGNLFGILGGVGISLILAKANFISIPGDVYYIDHLPIRLLPIDVITVALLAELIVLVATIYPASRAAKLDPIEAIRYG